MKLIDLTRINQLIDGLLDKINEKYATKAELNSGLKGKAEVNHGMHLTLGNTQNNAYRGDYGNAAYKHSQSAHAPSNAQKNSDITKAEVEAKLTGNITSHNHTKITAESGSSWTTATKDIQTDCEFHFASHITQSATGLFPRSNNANAMISFNRHSGPHASQLGFSSDGKIYYRAGLGTAITDSTAWQTIYTSSNKPTLADIGAAAASHGNHVPATQTASNKVFLRNDNTWQTITPDNIGAAKASHGTHVSYDTNAPKAAGTAAVGTSANVARADHVHPAQTTITGNAGSATKVNNNLVVKLNGGSTEETNLFTFNGSAAKTVNITASSIGAATSSSVGTLSSLKTSAKGNLVAAINELFQSANNGKQLIASAIGEPLDSNDTFSAMSTDINNLVSSFKNCLIDAGVDVNSNDKFKQLIDKLKDLNLSKGIEIVCTASLPETVVENQIVLITSNAPLVKEIKDYNDCVPTSNGQIIIGVSTTNNSGSMVPYSTMINNTVLTLYLAIAKGQFNNTLETYDGYIGRNGNWVNFSVGAHTLYANGYDAIGFTSTNNWSYSSTRIYFYSTSPALDLKMKSYNGGWNDEYAYFKNPIDLTNVKQVRIVGSYYNNGAEHSGVGFVASNSFTIYPTWAKKVNLTRSVEEVITDVSNLNGKYYFGTVNRCDSTARNAMRITEFELIY